MEIFSGNNALIGLFLLVMGLGMGIMGFTLNKTQNTNKAWFAFGIFYTIGIVGILGNPFLKNWLQIPSSGKSFLPLSSIIILIIGIILSFVLGRKKDSRFVILGILFSVGLHFLPFNTLYTYLLAIGTITNSVVAIVKPQISIYKSITIDACLKAGMGIVLLVL